MIPTALDLPPGARSAEVRTSFHLLDLQRIDDEAETFEFSGILTLVWRDARQAFDPAKEGVPERLYHGAHQFDELSPSWYPQVILANASQVPETQGILLPVRPDGACALIQDLHAIAREELIVCLCDRHGHFEKGDLVDRRCRWTFPIAHFVLILTAFLVLFLFY